MGNFELVARDGLARLGSLATPHGPIATPALLPVVHPDPSRQPIAPAEIRRRFGLSAVITSAYITSRTPPLRDRAEAEGIHGLLGFDGPVMTDSGAFQQHAYGSVEATPTGILGFQKRIGSDIATVLDIFVEPTASAAVAEAGVRTTEERAREARGLFDGLLAVPVQGGLHAELRSRSAAVASELGDVLAVGGVVPLMEQYRFADLARVLLAARPSLAPQGVVHLFGTGHPITFAFAALFGVDLFDSSAYLKFARRGQLAFPWGSVSVDDLREPICRCVLCDARPLTEVARLPAAERVTALAAHNLLTAAEEVARVRQAIRDGALWELVERRSAAHPALAAGLRSTVRGARVFLPAEPESRRSFRLAVATSALRPSALRFSARLRQWTDGRGPFRDIVRVPLRPEALRAIPTEDASEHRLDWQVPTPFGPVPLELTELYPVGCAVGPDEFGPTNGVEAAPTEPLDRVVEADRSRDWSEAWTARQVDSLLDWQFGTDAVGALEAGSLRGERSSRTGRLRAIVRDGQRQFVLLNDAVPRPTWRGAARLHASVPFPRQRIVVDPDAAPFVEAGKSLFSKFVRAGDAGLSPGSSCLLVDPDDRLLAVGRLVMAAGDMGRVPRGVAVRVTAHARGTEPEPLEEPGPGPYDGDLPTR